MTEFVANFKIGREEGGMVTVWNIPRQPDVFELQIWMAQMQKQLLECAARLKAEEFQASGNGHNPAVSPIVTTGG